MINPNDTAMLKNTLSFWDKLSKHEQELLCNNTRLITYRTRDNIHSPTNECVGVLLIKSGELRTYILSESGKDVTLFRPTQGEVCILSASCLLSNINFDVFVDAQKDTEVLLINPSIFAGLQSENLHVENFALKIAVDRFSDVMWAMEQILFMSFDARLAVVLLDEAAKDGTDKLALTHEQLAKYAGSAREVVSRMLKYFERDGLVKTYRGGVEIMDKDALRKLVHTKDK